MRTPEDHPTDADDLIRIGTIASVDHAGGRCTVTLDDDSTTGPIRWLAPRMGRTKVHSPPSVGEQVALLCPAGEVAGAMVLGGIASDAHPAPADQELDLIRFGDGGILSYDPASHALEITLPAGATVNLVAPGGVTITGDVAITGDLDVTGTATATTDVVGGGKSLKDHRHTAVQAGSGISGAPQ